VNTASTSRPKTLVLETNRPALAAVAQRGTGERGEFRVVQQGGAFSVVIVMVLNQSLVATSLITRSACAQGQLGIIGTPEWSATTCIVPIEAAASWVRKGKPFYVDPR
jgi:hypothetical protein